MKYEGYKSGRKGIRIGRDEEIRNRCMERGWKPRDRSLVDRRQECGENGKAELGM